METSIPFSRLVAIDSAEESKRLVSKKGVIIAGSGMYRRKNCIILSHIEKKYPYGICWISVEVLGREIVDRKKEIRVMGQTMQVNVEV